jgi:putative peptidoglycan lipid II flippase
LGGLGQLLIQVPALRSHGYRWTAVVSFRDPDVLRMVTLMTPAAVGIAAVQVNNFVSTFLASTLAQGSVSWLNYAYRLMQLPIGLFGVAVATVTLTEVARHAAQKNMVDLKETLSYSLRLVFLLTLPATLILLALARPIVALLYQHGKFTSNDTVETARALWGYGVGLAAFSAVRVMVPAFYSLGLARIPVMISFVTIGTTVVLNFILMGPLRRGLARDFDRVRAQLCPAAWMRSRIGGIGGRVLATAGIKILVAAIAAGAAWFAAAGVEGVVGLTTLAARLMVGAGLAAAGGLRRSATILRVEEFRRHRRYRPD